LAKAIVGKRRSHNIESWIIRPLLSKKWEDLENLYKRSQALLFE
jgi:hypothetical protein